MRIADTLRRDAQSPAQPLGVHTALQTLSLHTNLAVPERSHCNLAAIERSN